MRIHNTAYQDAEPEVPGQSLQEKEVPEWGHRVEQQQRSEGCQHHQRTQVQVVAVERFSVRRT